MSVFGSGRLAAAVLATLAPAFGIFLAPPAAHAAPCPDVQVVFARGTFEPPGVGGTGQAFVDALRNQVGNKSVDVYPVNYPASLDFPRAADGVIDASNKIRQTAAACPDTKTVLGGFSQGAAVAAYITADSVPPNFVLPEGITGPMPTDVADHVAAVALFGKPSTGFMNTIQSTAPPITIGHLYTAKTVEMCVDGDPVCSTDPGDANLHSLYATNGMADQAATFTAQRL
ncbi:cutinase family protein [Mycobacterium sp. NPDC003449]